MCVCVCVCVYVFFLGNKPPDWLQPSVEEFQLCQWFSHFSLLWKFQEDVRKNKMAPLLSLQLNRSGM